MCLIALNFQPGTEKGNRPTLLLVANRDEYYKRPSQRASFWKPGQELSTSDADDKDGLNIISTADFENPLEGEDSLTNDDLDKIEMIYGGKDLLQGGTWLACSSNGRFATITNFHCEQDRGRQYPRSRGEIVSTFTASSSWTAREFALYFLQEKLEEYAGFSVLLFDGTTLMCCTNRGNIDKESTDPALSWFRELGPGLYGLSNHLLDSPWPRTVQAKKVLATAIESLTSPYNGCLDETVVNKLLEGFADTAVLTDERSDAPLLEGDEIVLQCAVCVRLNGAGTRTTTIVCYEDKQGFEFIEKNFKTPFEKESWSREVIPLESPGGKHTVQNRRLRRANDRQASFVIS
jgi:uncharacterized protein with NRDE domain